MYPQCVHSDFGIVYRQVACTHYHVFSALANRSVNSYCEVRLCIMCVLAIISSLTVLNIYITCVKMLHVSYTLKWMCIYDAHGENEMHDLKLTWQPKLIISTWAIICVSWLKVTSVSGIIWVPIVRVWLLKILDISGTTSVMFNQLTWLVAQDDLSAWGVPDINFRTFKFQMGKNVCTVVSKGRQRLLDRKEHNQMPNTQWRETGWN
jgi:hypothetical protein